MSALPSASLSLVEEPSAPEGEFVRFPGSPFELFMPYPPAGDQPTAIAQLVEGVNDGEVFQTLLGVTGSGKTFTMANVIARLGRPAIVFAPNKTLAAQLYSEFREFFPKNAVEYFVSYYDYYQPEAYVPQRDLFIEKDSAINEHIEQMRLSCTKSILERRDVVIVATVSAIYGIGKPESYHQMVMLLRVGDKMGQRDLIAQLVRMQYARNEADFSRGKFRVRGDTIDVFPAEHSEMAIRIELFDDEIETLQLFDPLTGKVRQKIPRFTVYPSSHYVTPREQVLNAVELIKDELRERLGQLVGMGKLVEAQRLEQRTRFDLEMLSEVGHCKGIENYSRHLSGTAEGEPPSTLTDYLPKDALMFLDESHVLIGQFGGMYNGDRARKTTLVEYGFRLPSALDNRPLKLEEFEQRMRQVVFVSATPADYEKTHSGQVVEQPRALLYRTARNLLIDQHRRQAVRTPHAASGATDGAIGDDLQGLDTAKLLIQRCGRGRGAGTQQEGATQADRAEGGAADEAHRWQDWGRAKHEASGWRQTWMDQLHLACYRPIWMQT